VSRTWSLRPSTPPDTGQPRTNNGLAVWVAEPAWANLPAMKTELDHRSNDGIDVRLLWDRNSGRVSVTVDDSRTGITFEVEVGENDSPLEVFRHPYAHAAFQQVDTSVPAQLAA
jgi:hypothetical protein